MEPQSLDPLAELRAACAAAGSQRAWATQHHVSVTYLSDVLARRRPPGPAILDALGIERVETYRWRAREESRAP